MRDDAAQMAALQLQAELGPGLADNPETFMTQVEQFVTKQVFGTRPREEWRHDVGMRCAGSGVACRPGARGLWGSMGQNSFRIPLAPYCGYEQAPFRCFTCILAVLTTSPQS